MAIPEFDPLNQNATLLLADGLTKIDIPVGQINTFNDANISTVMNYGAQLGAAVIMLLVVLVMTPSSKFCRTLTILHILGLVICVVRMALLYANMRAPFNSFYQFWAQDFTHIPISDFHVSIAATSLSCLQVIVTELALMSQAWTMVTFWPAAVKYVVTIASIIVSLLTVGSRFTFTVIQAKSILTTEPALYFGWGVDWTLIMNAISIFWFCAIFNAKLLFHMISNRGILPSKSTVSPMEILVMANGILMLFPSIFAGLEWAHAANFEAGSLTVTSVVIVLPLGALAAQRISQSSNPVGFVNSHNTQNGHHRTSMTALSHQKRQGHGGMGDSNTSNSMTAERSVMSQSDMSSTNRDVVDPFDLELNYIDGLDTRASQQSANSAWVKGGTTKTYP